MSKPVPHKHGCPECPCTWDCHNPYCQDLEGKWCDGTCGKCDKPPKYLERLASTQEGREHVRFAAHLLRQAEEDDLAEKLEDVARLVQTRAEERAHGTKLRDYEADPPDLMADSADLHAGEV